MAKHHPWKDLERRHAKRMGGERIWRQDFSEVKPDGESKTDIWDCKCFARFVIVSLFLESEKKYRRFAQGRRFHLCLFSRRNPRAGDFVVLRADDFERLLAKEEALDNERRWEKESE